VLILEYQNSAEDISCLLKPPASPIDSSRSQTRVQGLRPHDGDGLQLRVRSNGSMLWNFNYREPVTKKRINMGFGTYPELSLATPERKQLQRAARPRHRSESAAQC
jgi:hypothetical protein